MKYLNLEADSLVELLMSRGNTDSSHELYSQIIDTVISAIWPNVEDFLAETKAMEKIHNCLTHAQLKELKVPSIPKSLFRDLVKEVEDNKYLKNDTERVFILSRSADLIIQSVHGWIKDSCNQRAQAIAMAEPNKAMGKKKGKIITMD